MKNVVAAAVSVSPRARSLPGLDQSTYLRYPLKRNRNIHSALAICARVRPSPTTTDPVVPAGEGEPFATLAARVKHLPIAEEMMSGTT
jgi:hypothetical protein